MSSLTHQPIVTIASDRVSTFLRMRGLFVFLLRDSICRRRREVSAHAHLSGVPLSSLFYAMRSVLPVTEAIYIYDSKRNYISLGSCYTNNLFVLQQNFFTILCFFKVIIIVLLCSSLPRGNADNFLALSKDI